MTAIRKLDHDELGMHLMQHHFAGSFNIAGGASIQGNFELERLTRTMDEFIALMPQLRSTISADGTTFIALPKPLLWQIHDYGETTESLEALVESALNSSIDFHGQPLWQLSTAYSAKTDQHHIIFYFHHSIADAFSLGRFLHEFLTAYASGKMEGNRISLASGFPKPTKDFLPKNNRGIKGAYTLMGYLTKVVTELEFKRPLYRPLHSSVDESQSCIESVFINKKDILAFKQEAKKHGASFHGALCAANLYAMKKMFNVEKPTFGVLTTINTRPKLHKEASEGLCARVGHSIQGKTINAEDHFWQTAKEIGNSVKNDIDKGYDIAGGKVLLPHIKKLVKQGYPDTSKCSLQVANGGKLPIRKNYGDISISNLCCAQNFKGAGNVLGSILTSNKDGLTNTLCFTTPHFSREEITTYAEAFKTIILANI